MHQHTRPRSRVFELGVVAAAVAWGAFLATTSGSAQGNAPPRKDPTALRTMHVQGNVHVMLGAGSNITLQVGNL